MKQKELTKTLVMLSNQKFFVNQLCIIYTAMTMRTRHGQVYSSLVIVSPSHITCAVFSYGRQPPLMCPEWRPLTSLLHVPPLIACFMEYIKEAFAVKLPSGRAQINTTFCRVSLPYKLLVSPAMIGRTTMADS